MNKIHWGLCCLFYEENIKFQTYTWKSMEKLLDFDYNEGKKKINEVWLNNINSLEKSIRFCENNNIDSYRVSSDLFPHFFKTKEFVNLDDIISKLSNIKTNIILSMHPGQHVQMCSESEIVIENSLLDLDYHFFIAKHLDIKEINIHVGSTYNNKQEAKLRFLDNFYLVKDKNKITLENDELCYSILDVLEIAEKVNVPVTYDFHHQRCYDIKTFTKTDEKEMFLLARKTWNSYQRVHLSSPVNGWKNSAMLSRPHHLYIDINDFPLWILEFDNVYMDVEAKAKEMAIFKLRKSLFNI